MKYKLLTTIFLGILLIGIVTSATWDNNKESINVAKGNKLNVGNKQLDYNSLWEKYKPIEITNSFGLGSTLFKGAITQHNDYCGTNCLSKFIVYLGEDGIPISNLKFYRLDEGKKEERSIRYYSLSYSGEVTDYDWRCIDTGKKYLNGSKVENCSSVRVGSHIGEISYNIGDILPKGTYEFTLIGEKAPYMSIDWVIISQGKIIEEWATWGNISTGSQAEVRLLSPSNNESAILGVFNLTGFANVTGGATLKNVTLYDNSTGTWGARNTTNLASTLTTLLSNLTQVDKTGAFQFVKNMTLNSSSYVTKVYSNISADSGAVTGMHEYNYHNGTKINVSSGDICSLGVWKDFNSTNPNPTYLVDYIVIYARSDNACGTTGSFHEKDTVVYGNQTVTNINISYLNNYSSGFIWNYLFCDSDDSCGFAQNNFTLNIVNDYFGICTETINQTYVVLSFKDETTSSSIQANISSAVFTYNVVGNSTNYSYNYANTTGNQTYSFCFAPGIKNISVTPAVYYSAYGYPQRIWSPGVKTYTNISTTEELYLLSTADGLDVTFQVLDSNSQVVSGVIVTGTKVSTSEVVVSGTTDAAGSVTFFLNPTYLHSFNFSKTGYPETIFNIVPTQSSYTVTLASGGATQYIYDYSYGISQSINPSMSTQFVNNTTYLLSYTLSSSYWNITEFGFTIYDDNKTILAQNTSSSNGGTLYRNIDTANKKRIILEYYYITNSTRIEGSARWNVFNTAYEGWSISTFFTDLNTYLGLGIFGLDTFGKYLIIFLILFLTIGIMSYKYGINSPASVSLMIFCVIFFFDVAVGLLPQKIGGIPNLPTFLAGAIAILFFWKEATQ